MTTLPTISREELYDRIVRGDAIRVFEVLGRPYYRKHHLPGALHMPPDRVREVATATIPTLDTEIVLYCWDDH